MNLRKSINIKYDLKDEKLINDYFSTSSHSHIIRNVFLGVLGENARSHIAFGPYGAGKSFISTILSGFLSKLYSDKVDIDLFITKFRNVDTEAAELFKKVSKHNIKYIPIVINGYEGPFEETLIRNLQIQVSKHIDISTMNIKNVVSGILNNWLNNYIETFINFNEFLKTNDWTIDSFLENLDNEKVLNDFKTFYRQVTSGNELQQVYNLDLIETFENMSELLQSHNYGILLVYDEFGRMLQNIEESSLNKFMQQLQDLAELANNKCANLSLLFVAHKPISHYFSYLDKDRRQEFAKIEKRFTTTNINSDNSTFINIASRIITEHRVKEIQKNSLEYHQRNLRKYHLFSNNFNETEIDELIIKGCYPIHPTSIYLLPLISKIFGQNERSLFSFILDTSNIGVLGMLKKHSTQTITPDKLVDYFFNDASLSDDSEMIEYAIFKNNYDLIKSRISTHEQLTAEAIYKFLMVWNITNSNSHLTVTSDLISYSLNLKKDIVEIVLQSLSNINVLRFNEITNSWQLINSSSFNFEDEYLKRKSILNQNINLYFITLNKYNPYRIIYCNDHNNKYQITRFAIVYFISEEYGYENTVDENSDFKIFMRIGSDVRFADNKKFITANLSKIDPVVNNAINRLSIIEILHKDRQFILENSNSLAELEYEKNKNIKILSSFYSSILRNSFSTYLGNFQTTSLYSIEKMLDEIANNLYSKSILIQNDQINMFTITKQQENPTIEIIDMLLQNETIRIDHLFEGNKPSHLIFYSISHADLSKLSAQLSNYLEENPSGKFSNLIEIVTQPPYGIRPTLASLIVIYLIIDRWKNMMFYNNGSFITNLTALQIYKTGLGLTDIEYTYSQFDFSNYEFLNFLLTEFRDVSEGVKNKSFSIRVLSAMNNWYISLPVITQLGVNLNFQEIEFIKHIKSAKIDPILALKEIINHFTTEDIQLVKRSIENSFTRYIDSFEQRIFRELEINDWKSYAKKLSSAMAKSNRLVGIALKSDSPILDYAQQVDSLEIQRWPLAMFEMLRNRIREDFDKSHLVNDATSILVNGIKKEVNNVQLSIKANTMKKNLENLINANAKYITNSEVEKVILDLVNTYIK